MTRSSSISPLDPIRHARFCGGARFRDWRLKNQPDGLDEATATLFVSQLCASPPSFLDFDYEGDKFALVVSWVNEEIAEAQDGEDDAS